MARYMAAMRGAVVERGLEEARRCLALNLSGCRCLARCSCLLVVSRAVVLNGYPLKTHQSCGVGYDIPSQTRLVGWAPEYTFICPLFE